MRKKANASSHLSMLAVASKHGHSKQHGHNPAEMIEYLIGFMLLLTKGTVHWEIVWGVYLIKASVCSCYCITTLRDLLFARLRTGEWNYGYLGVFHSKLCKVSVMWLIYYLAVAC